MIKIDTLKKITFFLLLGGGITCKVHTSPSVYSLDRLVAGFRTRSQMLLGHLEEQDEVLQCQFSDNSDDEESEGQEKSEIRYVDWFNKHKYMMQ